MEGIEKITAKILADAKGEADRLRAETDRKVAELHAQAESQAAQESAAILAKGERAAKERLERLSSAAAMETRKLELAAKQ